MRWLPCCFLCGALGCTSSSGSSGAGDLAPTCSAFGASDLTDGSTACTLHYGECSNGVIYSVTCPGPPAPCDCQVDGGLTGTFDGGVCGLSATSPALLSAVNQGCGWDIQ